MKLFLLNCSRMLLLPLLLLSFGSSVAVAQSINFQGFQNDCAAIRFQAVTNNGQPPTFTSWFLDGQFVGFRGGGVFDLTLPGTNLTANLFGPGFNFLGSATITTPEIEDFTISSSSNSLNLSGPSSSSTANLSAPRCIGSMSWDTEVETVSGTQDGIIADVRQESVNSVPSTAQLAVFFAVADASGSYLVRVIGTETLSGNSSSVFIFVSIDPTGGGCIFCPGFRDVATAEEYEVIEAAQRGLDEEQWVARDAEAIIRRVAKRLETETARLTDLEASSINTAAIYPNPASTEVNITYSDTPALIRMVDISGRQVASYAGSNIGPDRTVISTRDYKTGLYLIETTSVSGVRNVQKVQINN